MVKDSTSHSSQTSTTLKGLFWCKIWFCRLEGLEQNDQGMQMLKAVLELRQAMLRKELEKLRETMKKNDEVIQKTRAEMQASKDKNHDLMALRRFEANRGNRRLVRLIW